MLRFIITLTILISFSQSFAEGSKQLRPTSGDFGYIQINDKARTFATYSAASDERMYIHIKSTSEKINFGFGVITDGSTPKTDVYFRIKDPNGNVVMGPTKIPNTGMGFISSYTKAAAGPTTINAAGYTPFIFTPVTTGDYYIEFNQGSGTVVALNNLNKRVFEDFDITVIDNNTNTAKPGRLWSKNWDITSNSGANQFKGTFYVYSNDGVVTSINFNGIQPHAFRVACNSTGCVNTGNPALDRQSRAGNFTYSSYKIFLNDPDNIEYPNGVIGSLQTDIQLTGCAPNYCLNVTTDAPGYMEFVVNLNGVPGYQIGTKDLIFGQNVTAGTTCIPWDGNDGLGNRITQNINFEVNAEYKFGLTNLPIFDAENFNNGLIVSSIRPLVIKPKLFWDDSNISGGGSNFSGCVSNACHPWPSSNFGDERTINTWWYVNVVRDTIITQSIPKPQPNISGSASFCTIGESTNFSTPSIGGNSYQWVSRKNSINGSSTSTTINYITKLGIDTLTVLESNSIGCYEDTIFVSCYPTPTPIVSGDTSACDINTIDVYTTNNIAVNTYQWSISKGIVMLGGSTNTVQVKWTTIGLGYIEVVETTPNGCTTTKRRNVQVVAKPVITGITH
jgi:hypothetical protein